MKCLVTGGAGFIGSHVVDLLLQEGHGVAIVDNLSTGKNENVPDGVRLHVCDIRSPELIRVVTEERPDAIFHFAAVTSVAASIERPFQDADNNVLGSLRVFEAARAGGVSRIILASSVGVYGDAKILPTPEHCASAPLSPYAVGKLAVEHYGLALAPQYEFSFTALRFANVYGPRQDDTGEAGVVAKFVGSMLTGKHPVVYGDGLQTRDFLYVKDAAAAAFSAMTCDKTGIINIGTGRETTILDLFALIAKEIGENVPKIHREAIAGEIQRSGIDASKARVALGWEPRYSLEKGLEDTTHFFKQHAA